MSRKNKILLVLLGIIILCHIVLVSNKTYRISDHSEKIFTATEYELLIHKYPSLIFNSSQWYFDKWNSSATYWVYGMYLLIGIVSIVPWKKINVPKLKWNIKWKGYYLWAIPIAYVFLVLIKENEDKEKLSRNNKDLVYRIYSLEDTIQQLKSTSHKDNLLNSLPLIDMDSANTADAIIATDRGY